MDVLVIMWCVGAVLALVSGVTLYRQGELDADAVGFLAFGVFALGIGADGMFLFLVGYQLRQRHLDRLDLDHPRAAELIDAKSELRRLKRLRGPNRKAATSRIEELEKLIDYFRSEEGRQAAIEAGEVVARLEAARTADQELAAAHQEKLNELG